MTSTSSSNCQDSENVSNPAASTSEVSEQPKMTDAELESEEKPAVDVQDLGDKGIVTESKDPAQQSQSVEKCPIESQPDTGTTSPTPDSQVPPSASTIAESEKEPCEQNTPSDSDGVVPDRRESPCVDVTVSVGPKQDEGAMQESQELDNSSTEVEPMQTEESTAFEPANDEASNGASESASSMPVNFMEGDNEEEDKGEDDESIEANVIGKQSCEEESTTAANEMGATECGDGEIPMEGGSSSELKISAESAGLEQSHGKPAQCFESQEAGETPVDIVGGEAQLKESSGMPENFMEDDDVHEEPTPEMDTAEEVIEDRVSGKASENEADCDAAQDSDPVAETPTGSEVTADTGKLAEEFEDVGTPLQDEPEAVTDVQPGPAADKQTDGLQTTYSSNESDKAEEMAVEDQRTEEPEKNIMPEEDSIDPELTVQDQPATGESGSAKSQEPTEGAQLNPDSSPNSDPEMPGVGEPPGHPAALDQPAQEYPKDEDKPREAEQLQKPEKMERSPEKAYSSSSSRDQDGSRRDHHQVGIQSLHNLQNMYKVNF